MPTTTNTVVWADGGGNGTPLQWKRIYELVIGNEAGNHKPPTEKQSKEKAKKKNPRLNNKGVLITDLAISFKIRKSSDKTRRSTNHCEITIYNLSDDSLAYLEQDYPVVVLRVGYENIGLKTLFFGNVITQKTEKKGPDRVTTITADTAYTAVNFSMINTTIGAGSNLEDIMEFVRKSMDGLNKGVYAGTRVKTMLPYGIPLSGTPRQILDELCRAYNLEWRIDNNILYVNDIEVVTNKNLAKAQLFTYDTGLLEGPYFTLGREGRAKKDARRAEGLHFKALLNADTIPGSAVRIKTKEFDGLWKVDHVEFSGEWGHGNDWTMNIECVTFDEEKAREAWRKKHKPKKESKKVYSPGTALPAQ